MECKPIPSPPWKRGSYDLEAQWRMMMPDAQDKIVEEANKNLEKTGAGTKIAMGLIKATVGVYDVATMPVYFAVQRPWRWWKKPKYIKKLDPSNPASPYVAIRPPALNGVDGVGTVDQLFREAVKRYGPKPCFGYREVLGEEQEVQADGKSFRKLILSDSYKWLSYYDVEERVERLSRALLSIGVRPRNYVCILAETRLEWMLAAQACFRINAPVATLYATLGEDGIVHGLNETAVSHLVTSSDLLPKLKKLASSLTHLHHIVYMEGPTEPDIEGFPEHMTLLSFSAFEKQGESYDMEVKGEKPKPEDEAIIMYTSGSTGVPKGVILLHSNILITAGTLGEALPPLKKGDVYMGYLPLAHILEMAAECVFFWNGIPNGYSTPLTMTDNSTAIPRGGKGDTTLLRPTLMVAVPLVLDRIRKGITEKVKAKGKFAKSLFNFAVKYKIRWYYRGFQTPIMDRLIFGKIRQVVGGRLHTMASGGAPLSADTHDFIRACLGVNLVQGYGLTETGGCGCVMVHTDRYSGLVGPPLSVCKIRLEDWKEGGYSAADEPNPRGEIVIGGPCVAAGYFKNPKATEECFFTDANGERWFATGDIGEVFPDGAFKIIDRKKDLVKLQFGEYVSLGKVESELKTSPLVDNICVYGNGFHTYLVALVAPNQPYLRSLGKELGKEHLTFQELCNDELVVAAATKGLIDHANKCRLLKTEIPTKIKLCSEEWLPDTGLVTAALKIRRRAIEQFYQKDLEALYGGEQKPNSKLT